MVNVIDDRVDLVGLIEVLPKFMVEVSSDEAEHRQEEYRQDQKDCYRTAYVHLLYAITTTNRSLSELITLHA